MLTLDADLLRVIAPKVTGTRAVRQAEIIADVGAALEDTLEYYDIFSRIRIAHFLAQIAHECDGFCTTEEYASGKDYEGRLDLGNTQKGDGVRFKGRGLLQLTGRFNYAAMSDTLGIDLVADPHLAAEPVTSLKIAGEYWKSRKINVAADADDLITVTRKVNGGLRGLAERQAYLAKAKVALAGKRAEHIANPSGGMPVLHRGLRGDAVEVLQRRLRAQGYLVAIDGDFGPGTETAVRHFQATRSLKVDGIVGPSTWGALPDELAQAA
ncbi:peptidoglycan-binding protein [Methylobrevis albus]|uniref:Peptidoglycan-binding protein n=1 Tax=Methylobrevis albus TaxID=2793297 RepID=A0A931HYS2_9HYPH|nr:peptidoglycan-binding protein [Methylobrevis albus]MBH0236805.1 peptidoglycan-binding protein [Methylobrevis albus]